MKNRVIFKMSFQGLIKFSNCALRNVKKFLKHFQFVVKIPLVGLEGQNRYLLEKGHFDIKIKNIRECSQINETIGDFEKTIKPWGIKASYMTSIWSNQENVCGISC